MTAISVALLTACGPRQTQAPQQPEAEPQQPTGAPTVVTLEASEFRFAPANATAQRGQVTFRVTNTGQIVHNFKLPQQTVGVESIDPGQTVTVNASLQPGTYRFVCDIPGHEDAGMHGEVTVR